MKHCPNPDCPFLQEYKMVAEFHDEIEFCPDCATQLVAGEAPELELPPAAYEPLFSKTGDLDLVTLCIVDSEADADFYKEKLEFQDIPVAIVRQSVAAEDPTTPPETVPPETVQHETVLFDVQVLRSDLMRATLFLDTLAPLDTEEIEADDDDHDDKDRGDEDRDINSEWSETDDDDESEDALAAAASASHAATNPAMQADEAGSERTGRANSLVLIIVIGVVLVLIVLFLIRAFA
jgi:hypothetical protein